MTDEMIYIGKLMSLEEKAVEEIQKHILETFMGESYFFEDEEGNLEMYFVPRSKSKADQPFRIGYFVYGFLLGKGVRDAHRKINFG